MVYIAIEKCLPTRWGCLFESHNGESKHFSGHFNKSGKTELPHLHMCSSIKASAEAKFPALKFHLIFIAFLL